MRRAITVILLGALNVTASILQGIGTIFLVTLVCPFLWVAEKLDHIPDWMSSRFHFKPGFHRVAWSENITERTLHGYIMHWDDLLRRPYLQITQERRCTFPGCTQAKSISVREEPFDPISLDRKETTAAVASPNLNAEHSVTPPDRCGCGMASEGQGFKCARCGFGRSTPY